MVIKAGRLHFMELSKYTYATIGTDGENPVVWGFGATPELALREAEGELRAFGRWGRSVFRQDLLTVAITEEQAQRICLSRGVTTAESLGVPLPRYWLMERGTKLSVYPESLILEEESPWYYVEGVRYCKVCRTRRCEKQVGGDLKCPPEKTIQELVQKLEVEYRQSFAAASTVEELWKIQISLLEENRDKFNELLQMLVGVPADQRLAIGERVNRFYRELAEAYQVRANEIHALRDSGL